MRSDVSNEAQSLGAQRDARALAEHVLWCREECEEMRAELAQFEAGDAGVGTPARMTLLRGRIEQLKRVIAACELPDVAATHSRTEPK